MSLTFQLMILKLRVITDTAKVLMAWNLFAKLSLLLSISLILLQYSFLIFSFIVRCWIPSPSLTPWYLYVPSCSSSLMVVVMSIEVNVAGVGKPTSDECCLGTFV